MGSNHIDRQPGVSYLILNYNYVFSGRVYSPRSKFIPLYSLKFEMKSSFRMLWQEATILCRGLIANSTFLLIKKIFCFLYKLFYNIL